MIIIVISSPLGRGGGVGWSRDGAGINKMAGPQDVSSLVAHKISDSIISPILSLASEQANDLSMLSLNICRGKRLDVGLPFGGSKCARSDRDGEAKSTEKKHSYALCS